jgi:FixJ family two-component response regulator
MLKTPAINTAYGTQWCLTAVSPAGARAAAQRARRQLTSQRGPTRGIRRTDPLSVREREVLTHFVGNHVSAIFDKLGVENRTQAAAHAHRPPNPTNPDVNAKHSVEQPRFQ